MKKFFAWAALIIGLLYFFLPLMGMTRFSLMQQLRGDLAKAKANLESRKVVDRAKGLLMKERGLDEDAAYKLLRKLAMDKGRPIGAVAADLLAFAGLLKGDGS